MSRYKEFKQKQLAGTSAALQPLCVNDLTASLMENNLQLLCKCKDMIDMMVDILVCSDACFIHFFAGLFA